MNTLKTCKNIKNNLHIRVPAKNDCMEKLNERIKRNLLSKVLIKSLLIYLTKERHLKLVNHDKF